MPPRDGAGTFNRPVDDYVAGTVISETSVNTEMDQIATALTNSVAADGQTTPTANLPMATFKHTGVGDADARDQYLAVGQLQDGKINWAVATGTAQAITANYTPAVTAIVDGMLLGVRAKFANTAALPTFSPNGLAAIGIKKYGTDDLVAGDIAGLGHEILLRYVEGFLSWELLNPAIVDGGNITGVNADKLDSIDSTQFIRSDADDSASGDLIFSGNLTLSGKTIIGGTGAPIITLALGDTDTGFKWVSDGNFQVFANAIDIVEYSSGNVKFNVRPHYGSSNLAALSDWALSASANGYTTLPNGVTMQWGSVSVGANNSGTAATFPIAFPTACLQGFATGATTSTGLSDSSEKTVSAVSTTQITIGNNGDAATVRWLAIGH